MHLFLSVSMDKENESPAEDILFLNAKTPPLATSTDGARKSAGKSTSKRVRFSIAPNDDPESPFVFPSERQLLDNRPPAASPARPLPTPPSTGSRHSCSGLSNAFSKFLNNQDLVKPPARLFDTPSRRASRASESPLDQGGDTPGCKERQLFGFQFSEDDRAGVFVRDDGLNFSLVDGATPARGDVGTDDPALAMSVGVTSAGSSRRRRRLSNIGDIESELLSSPDRVIHAEPKPQTPAKTVPEFFNRCLEYLTSKPLFVDIQLPKFAPPENDSILRKNYMQAVAVTLESAKNTIEEINGTYIASIRKNVSALDESLFQQYISLGPDEFNQTVLDPIWASIAPKFQSLLADTMQDLILNLKDIQQQFGAHIDTASVETVRVIEELDEIEPVLDEMEKYISMELARARGEHEQIVVNRVKSSEEILLSKLEHSISEKEANITERILTITQLESQLQQRELDREKSSVALRDFYHRNGWYVMEETSREILVYSCCQVLIFQRAVNNANVLQYRGMLPVKMKPDFTDTHLVNEKTFRAPTDYSDMFDDVPFEFEPQSFYDLVSSITSELCRLTRIKERLFVLKRRLNVGCSKYMTKVEINANFQIEIVIAAENESIGTLCPVVVKMMWFDFLRAETPVDYSNCSFIISDATEAGFPGLRYAVQAQIEDSSRVWDAESFELLESIVNGIHSTAKSIRGCVPSFVRE
jgi:hypothetical protein